MKTYILRDPNSVEPQKAPFLDSPQPSHTHAPTSLADVSSQGSQPKALFIGMDVHNVPEGGVSPVHPHIPEFGT
jgi:hypothetical protein